MFGMKKKEPETAAVPPAGGTTAPGTAGTAGAVPPVAGAPGATSGSATPVPAPAPASIPASALAAGPGLPKPVIQAWKGGDTVVLLLVREAGVDDKLTETASDALNDEADVSLFVDKAKNIARYARITQAVAVNRVPALVVVRPKESEDSSPEAQVSYGL